MSARNPKPTANSQSPRLSKNEAVRQALKALGKSASRTEIKEYVQTVFGIEMGLDHVSTAKAEALRKMKMKKLARKTAAPQPSAGMGEIPTVAPTFQARPARAANGKGVQLEDILALRKLVDQVGPEELQILINVMAK